MLEEDRLFYLVNCNLLLAELYAEHWHVIDVKAVFIHKSQKARLSLQLLMYPQLGLLHVKGIQSPRCS